MALRKGLPAKLAATDADDTRYDLAGLIVCNADGTPRGGVLSPVGVNLVTATGTMNVSVARFQGAAVRDAGVVLLANDGPTNVLLDAAPAANSRIDVVWAKQNDSSSTVSVPDANDLPVFGVSKGTAGAVPVKPSVPAGALELATVQVPSTATATNSSGVVITQSAQFTAAAGGVVPFRTVADMDAVTSLVPGTRAHVLATKGKYAFNGSKWEGSTFVQYTAAGAVPWPTTAATVTQISTPVAVDTSAFSWAAGVFTCVRPGRYRIDARVTLANAATNSQLNLLKNGVAVMSAPAFGAVTNLLGVPISEVLQMAVGDTISLSTQGGSHNAGQPGAIYNRITITDA